MTIFATQRNQKYAKWNSHLSALSAPQDFGAPSLGSGLGLAMAITRMLFHRAHRSIPPLVVRFLQQASAPWLLHTVYRLRVVGGAHPSRLQYGVYYLPVSLGATLFSISRDRVCVLSMTNAKDGLISYINNLSRTNLAWKMSGASDENAGLKHRRCSGVR